MRLADEEAWPRAVQERLRRFFNVTVVAVPRIVTRNAHCIATLGAFVDGKKRDAKAKSVAAAASLPLRSIFSVFNVWGLTQFDRVVWLEADQLVLRPLDDLFGMELDHGAVGAATSVLDPFRGFCSSTGFGANWAKVGAGKAARGPLRGTLIHLLLVLATVCVCRAWCMVHAHHARPPIARSTEARRRRWRPEEEEEYDGGPIAP